MDREKKKTIDLEYKIHNLIIKIPNILQIYFLCYFQHS